MSATDFLPAVTQEQFEAMAPAEQRVAIARDVLAQLDAERIRPAKLVWVNAEVEGFDYSRPALVAGDAPACRVCGIGACFVSAVRLGNGFAEAADNGLGEIHMQDVVGQYFSQQKFVAIEFVFERGNGYTSLEDLVELGWSENETDALCLMFPEAETPDDRLRLIAENLIANGGDLVPPVENA